MTSTTGSVNLAHNMPAVGKKLILKKKPVSSFQIADLPASENASGVHGASLWTWNMPHKFGVS